MSITLSRIAKRFGSYVALRGVDLAARQGEFLALLGPSGSGKTTLLRIIAGLDFPDEGTIRFDGRDVGGAAARDRGVGFVFQHYALFRHMTVAENIAFGLRVKPRRERPRDADIRRRVDELLGLVHLASLGHRYPSQLSGGQRQRVALARALAVEPQVLLLDEPFGALDAKVRNELRRWLRRLHQEMGLTSIFVTHDQEEALELADRVVVMNQGRIEQTGTPTEVYDDPATPFVYEFLGNANRLDCRVAGGAVHLGGLVLPLVGEVEPAEAAIGFVRPHDLAVALAGGAPGLPATIRQVFAAGPAIRLDCDVSGAAVEVALPREEAQRLPLAPGLSVSLRPRRLRVFTGGRAHDAVLAA